MSDPSDGSMMMSRNLRCLSRPTRTCLSLVVTDQHPALRLTLKRGGAAGPMKLIVRFVESSRLIAADAVAVVVMWSWN